MNNFHELDILINFWNNFEFELSKYFTNIFFINNFSKEIKLCKDYSLTKNKISQFINSSLIETILSIKSQNLNYDGRHYLEHIKKWFLIDKEFIFQENLIFNIFFNIIYSKKTLENKIIIFNLFKKFIISKNNLFLEYILCFSIEFNYVKIVGILFSQEKHQEYIKDNVQKLFIDFNNIQPIKLIKYLKPKYTLQNYQNFL